MTMALTFAAGNVSAWLVYAALNVEPKYLVPTNAKAPKRKPPRSQRISIGTQKT